jgi:arsenate reductase
MAEGWARALKAEVIEPFSAGIVAHGQNPNAIRVMAEAGVDITPQGSKTLQSLLDRGVEFDVVVTVCGHADENCPLFPGKTRVVHVPFDDPPKLAKGATTEEEALGHYRRVRDEIRKFVEKLPHAIGR